MDKEENCDFSYLIFDNTNSSHLAANFPSTSNEIFGINPISLLESITKGDVSENNNYKDNNTHRIDSEDVFLNEISSQYIQGLISFEFYKELLDRGWSKKDVDSCNKYKKDVISKKASHNNQDLSEEEELYEKLSDKNSDEDYEPISEIESEPDLIEDKLDKCGFSSQEKSKIKTKRKTRLPKHLQGLMGTANLSWVNGNKDEAENICNQIIQSAPSAHEPYSLLSLIFEERGLIDKSNQYALIAAHLDCSNSPDPWLKLAENAKKNENNELALDYYKKAISMFKKNLLQKKAIEDNVISQYINAHYESASLNEKNGDVRKSAKDYQGILNIVSHQRKYIDMIDIKYKSMVISVTQTLSKLYHSLNDFKEAHNCLNVIFERYPLSDIDIGLLNLFVDIQVTQAHYLEAMLLLGQFCEVDWTLPAKLGSDSKLPEGYDKEGIPSLVPSNFPIDFQAKLAICLIHSRGTYEPQHNFALPFYRELLGYLEESLLGLDPDAFGDLFIDMTEAYKDCQGKGDGLDCARALPFFHKILGIGPDPGPAHLTATKLTTLTAYANVPGIWLAYGEALEALGLHEQSVVAMKKVVDLAPHHQLSHFKLRRMLGESGGSGDKRGTELGPVGAKAPGTSPRHSTYPEALKEPSPYPSSPVTLTLLTNVTRDLATCTECLEQCLAYYGERRAQGPASARDNFLSLGLSIFFSIASESLANPNAETFYKSLAQTVVRDAELKLGVYKGPVEVSVPLSGTALPLSTRTKLDRLFQLLVSELRPPSAVAMVTNDLLFLYACAMGSLGQFSNARFREGLRYQTLCAAFHSRRWRYTLVCVKCFLGVLVKSDWFSNQAPPKSAHLHPPQPPSGSHPSGYPEKRSILIRLLVLLVRSVQGLQSYHLASIHPDYFGPRSTYHVIGDARGPHTAITRKICTFLLKQIRFYDYPRGAARRASPSSPCHQTDRQRRELAFLLAWAYACLNHSTGSYGIAMFEYKGALPFLLDHSPLPNGPSSYAHLKPLVFLSMGTALLELACGRKMFWLGPYPPPTPRGQTSYPGDGSTKGRPVCHSMLPLSYAFVCLAAYARLRGPCQEVYYNLGRAYHQIDMLSQAVEHYAQALTYPAPGMAQGCANFDFDLSCVIAYNLSLLYKFTGRMEMACYITQKYLTIR